MIDLMLVLGGLAGALLRRAGEWATVPSILTAKGTLVEALAGAAGVLVLARVGLLPAALTGGGPVLAFAAAGLVAYLPIDVLRAVQDWLRPPDLRGARLQPRRGLAAWR